MKSVWLNGKHRISFLESNPLSEDKKLDHYLEFIHWVKANKNRRNIKASDIKNNLVLERIDDITESDIKRLNFYNAVLKLLGA